MVQTRIILNPVAGRGHSARAEPQLRRLLQAEGLDFDLLRTNGPWHAAELAEQAARDGVETVVAAGGDGTTREVVNGLMAASNGNQGATGAATLGIIPLGSGSDFAYAVGVPANLAGACHCLVHGRDRAVDIVQITMPNQAPRYFNNTTNIGFGGVVNLEARKIKWLRGIALYLPAVLKTIFLSLHAPRVTIRYDEQEMVLKAMMITVANGPREGGAFYVAPDALPDDGLLDLCIARDISRLAILGLVPHFLKGTHVGRKPITMARARRISVTSPDDLIAHVDGEMLCTNAHQIDFEILPQRLRVRC